MTNASSEKLELITAPTATIEHSRWANRLHCLTALTGVLAI
jgi:hypothetical protein